MAFPKSGNNKDSDKYYQGLAKLHPFLTCCSCGANYSKYAIMEDGSSFNIQSTSSVNQDPIGLILLLENPAELAPFQIRPGLKSNMEV